MSYLLDKKNKRKKVFYVVFSLVFISTLFYFRNPLFSSLSFVSHVVFRPVFVLQNKLSSSLTNWGVVFSSKSSLVEENQNLKLKLKESNAFLLNYDSLFEENIKIKEILGRKEEKKDMLLSAILSKPNQSPYDTLVIDVGINDGIETGDLVFALGDLPIGRIFFTYPNSSKVVLFSNSGEKTEVVLTGQDVFMQIVGRGGGNFEMILPRDFILEKGSAVVLPGISSYVVAIVDTVLSDPRDSFTKVLLTSPVNIQELKFVQIEI